MLGEECREFSAHSRYSVQGTVRRAGHLRLSRGSVPIDPREAQVRQRICPQQWLGTANNPTRDPEFREKLVII